jgi:hypothetical protein
LLNQLNFVYQIPTLPALKRVLSRLRKERGGNGVFSRKNASEKILFHLIKNPVNTP